MVLGYDDENANSDVIETSVTGLVTASGWDDYNNVTELKLFSMDEDEYLIENGLSFVDVLRKFILAKGIVKKNMHGGKSIEIKEFKLLEQGVGESFPA